MIENSSFDEAVDALATTIRIARLEERVEFLETALIRHLDSTEKIARSLDEVIKGLTLVAERVR